MPDHLNQESRAHIAVFLPKALSKALSSYHEFMEQDIPDDAKGFSAYHSAAKVAIAHVELLMKMAKWTETSENKKDDNFTEMISRAEQEVNGYRYRQDVWEQGGEGDGV